MTSILIETTKERKKIRRQLEEMKVIYLNMNHIEDYEYQLTCLVFNDIKKTNNKKE